MNTNPNRRGSFVLSEDNYNGRTCTPKGYLRSTLLTMLVLGYLLMGAFVFYKLEADYEEKDTMQQERKLIVTKLLTAITVNNYTSETHNLSMEIEKALVEYYEKASGHHDYHWEFYTGYVLSLTIVTTIGYGHIVPKTGTGKIFSMVYAIVGIPIFLLFLSNLGNCIATAVRKRARRLILYKEKQKLLKRNKQRSRSESSQYNVSVVELDEGNWILKGKRNYNFSLETEDNKYAKYIKQTNDDMHPYIGTAENGSVPWHTDEEIMETLKQRNHFQTGNAIDVTNEDIGGRQNNAEKRAEGNSMNNSRKERSPEHNTSNIILSGGVNRGDSSFVHIAPNKVLSNEGSDVVEHFLLHSKSDETTIREGLLKEEPILVHSTPGGISNFPRKGQDREKSSSVSRTSVDILDSESLNRLKRTSVHSAPGEILDSQSLDKGSRTSVCHTPGKILNSESLNREIRTSVHITPGDILDSESLNAETRSSVDRTPGKISNSNSLNRERRTSIQNTPGEILNSDSLNREMPTSIHITPGEILESNSLNTEKRSSVQNTPGVILDTESLNREMRTSVHITPGEILDSKSVNTEKRALVHNTPGEILDSEGLQREERPRTPGGILTSERLVTEERHFDYSTSGENNMQCVNARLTRDIKVCPHCHKEVCEEEEALAFLMLILMLTSYLFISAVIVTSVESEWTFLEAMYFCVMSATTIGFGDYVMHMSPHQIIQYIQPVLMASITIIGLMILSALFNTAQNGMQIFGGYLVRVVKVLLYKMKFPCRRHGKGHIK